MGVGLGVGVAVGVGVGVGVGLGAGAAADAETAPAALTSKLNVLFAEAWSEPPALTLIRSLPFEGVAVTV